VRQRAARAQALSQKLSGESLESGFDHGEESISLSEYSWESLAIRDVVSTSAPKPVKTLVGRDGIEPPTPGFSDLSLGVANDAEVLAVLNEFASVFLPRVLSNALECP